MSLAADPSARPGRRSALSAKPVLIRTKPFTFAALLVWLLAIASASGLIYWVGAERLKATVASGVFEISGVEIAVLVFAVGVLCWLVTQCWKYFDPYPDIRISPGVAQLGTSFDLEWTFRGSKSRLRGLAIALEGREEVLAENKLGKQAAPQKLTAPFYVEQLDVPQHGKEAHVHVQLPEGLMPTFESNKTKITWLVRFESQIKWGAKMRFEFPVRVLPEGANG